MRILALSIGLVWTSATLAQDTIEVDERQQRALVAIAAVQFAEENCVGKPDKLLFDGLHRQLSNLTKEQVQLLLVKTHSTVDRAAKRTGAAAVCAQVVGSYGPQGNLLPGLWLPK